MNAALSTFSQCPAQFRPSNACKTLQSPRELCEEVSARDTGRERSTRDQRRESREREREREKEQRESREQTSVCCLSQFDVVFASKAVLVAFPTAIAPVKEQLGAPERPLSIPRRGTPGERVEGAAGTGPHARAKKRFFGGGIDEANFPFSSRATVSRLTLLCSQSLHAIPGPWIRISHLSAGDEGERRRAVRREASREMWNAWQRHARPSRREREREGRKRKTKKQ